jgi:chromosome partitioning protein
MPLVLAVANLKGGVGKSTIALNLAVTLHRDAHRVILVDTDRQGTCRTWAAVAAEAKNDGPPVVAVDGRSLRRDLVRIAQGFDVVIIDTPPHIGADMTAALLVSDLVLLPLVPGVPDVWALRDTVALIREAQQPGMRPDLRALVVLNKAKRSTLTRVTREALDEFGLPVFTMGDRVAFGEATAQGRGVVELGSKGSEAAEEMTRLVHAALKLIEGDGAKQWRKKAKR